MIRNTLPSRGVRTGATHRCDPPPAFGKYMKAGTQWRCDQCHTLWVLDKLRFWQPDRSVR